MLHLPPSTSQLSHIHPFLITPCFLGFKILTTLSSRLHYTLHEAKLKAKEFKGFGVRIYQMQQKDWASMLVVKHGGQCIHYY